VIYLTACANDFARENKRQTITANDILAAVKEVDFDEFTPKLVTFIERHRKSEKAKRERKKSMDEMSKTNESPSKKEETLEEPDKNTDQNQEYIDADDIEPVKKRQKRNHLDGWEDEPSGDVEDYIDDGRTPGNNIADGDEESHNGDTEDED